MAQVLPLALFGYYFLCTANFAAGATKSVSAVTMSSLSLSADSLASIKSFLDDLGKSSLEEYDYELWREVTRSAGEEVGRIVPARVGR